MSYATRELEGTLFPNARKAAGKQPDYTGNVRIGGVLYRLAAWKRRSGPLAGRVVLKASPLVGEGAAEPRRY